MPLCAPEEKILYFRAFSAFACGSGGAGDWGASHHGCVVITPLYTVLSLFSHITKIPRNLHHGCIFLKKHPSGSVGIRRSYPSLLSSASLMSTRLMSPPFSCATSTAPYPRCAYSSISSVSRSRWDAKAFASYSVVFFI